MPSEPVDTSVTALRHTIGRLDATISAAAADLDHLDTVDRAIVGLIVEAAIHDDGEGERDVLAARLDPGNRSVITHRLTQLRLARDSAMSQLSRAEHIDPAVVRWRARCAEVSAEWQAVMATENRERRHDALVEFAVRH